MSHAAQTKLLHFIQENKITRVGDNKPIKVDVRIIAAGNESFNDMLLNKRFRRDLYERFVDKITIPALRERKEDIDFFIDRFLEEKSNVLGKKSVMIEDDARDLLRNYKWEGNVRQLMNFIHKLVTRVKQNENTQTYIIRSNFVMKCYLNEIQTEDEEIITKDYTWKTAQKIAFKRALERANGNDEKAIALLGISRGTYYKWKKGIV